jgi:predicted O-linked N-acetylglucosamine transferase (SPINDLY family)
MLDAPLLAAEHVSRALAAGAASSALDGELAELASALAPAVASAALEHKRAGRLDNAEALFRRAIALAPDDPRAHANLALTVLPLGRAREAATHLARARELAPSLPGLDEAELLLLHYTTDASPRVVFEAHARWGARFATTRRLALPARAATPARPLRVGYVSPDLRDHSVAHFLLPVLEAHDPRAVAVFAYAHVLAPDAVTARFRALPLTYRPIAELDDDAVARLVAGDGIDVLVDLAGHMADGRLAVFARKPAPVQLTWLGYPDTTGLAAIDGRLTDAVADPPGEADALAVETLVRLPRTAWTFRPLHPAPAPRPRDAGRPLTFGGFNNLAKVGPETLAAWAELLATTPDARLVLKCRGLGSRSAAAATRAVFAARGVADDRVELRGWEPEAAGHLAAYHAVDIALDTFPYGGTTTTCEALYMGVPVVTLAGDRHAARVGASLLHTLGLDELVAGDVAGYVQRARALAADRARLAGLRAGLRARFEASPLGDAGAFTRDLEATYLALFRRWIERGSPVAPRA